MAISVREKIIKHFPYQYHTFYFNYNLTNLSRNYIEIRSF